MKQELHRAAEVRKMRWCREVVTSKVISAIVICHHVYLSHDLFSVFEILFVVGDIVSNDHSYERLPPTLKTHDDTHTIVFFANRTLDADMLL